VTERVLLENGKWSGASLRIGGETVQPDDIGAALGLKATRAHLKGQPRSERTPIRKAVWPDSMWLLSSPLGKERDLAEHLRWLLDAIEPRLDVFKSLSAKYKTILFCGFSSGNGQGGFTLDSHTLSRIANLGIPFVLDLYPPAIDEEIEPE